MPDSSVKTLLQFAYLFLSNFGSFMAIIMIYTKIIHKQAKIEFLIKRVCQKLDISTDTEL